MPIDNVITESFISSDTVRRHSAPSGKVFEILGFHVFNYTTKGEQLLVTDRYIEEEKDRISLDESIFGVDLQIDGMSTSMTLPEPIRAKNISVGTNTSSEINAVIYIYVRIVSADVRELVLEFVKRGKNP